MRTRGGSRRYNRCQETGTDTQLGDVIRCGSLEADLLRLAVRAPLRISARQEPRDVLAVERGDVVDQALGLGPRLESAHVALILRHRVLRSAVGLELDLEAGEGVGEQHGRAWNVG
jgi:hypothetical protein